MHIPLRVEKTSPSKASQIHFVEMHTNFSDGFFCGDVNWRVIRFECMNPTTKQQNFKFYIGLLNISHYSTLNFRVELSLLLESGMI